MLKQRVITAIVLLAILLPALFASSPLPFTVLALIMAAAAAWEWGRLNGLGRAGSVATGATCLLLCLLAWRGGMIEQNLSVLWVFAALLWVLGSAYLIKAGVSSWQTIPLVVRWSLGLFALWVVWLAIAQARMRGVNFLLSVMALVWVADITAYFAGRAFGLKWTKNKLAPAISPGKSWEGAWGGMLGVIVLGVAWVQMDASMAVAYKSFYSDLLSKAGWAVFILALLFLAAMSVTGDLVESLIKRSAGVKDSSQLLPGHGGVLDRIDALLPVMPIAMMLMTVVQ